jgi:hypothetical protein
MNATLRRLEQQRRTVIQLLLDTLSKRRGPSPNINRDAIAQVGVLPKVEHRLQQHTRPNQQRPLNQ